MTPWKNRQTRGTSTASALRAGLLFGLLAGGVFLLATLAVVSVTGMRLEEPLRYAGSIVLGPRALAQMSPLTAGIAGVAVHFAISAFYGVSYGLLDSMLSPDDRARPLHQMAVGAFFGIAVWLMNFQFLARRYFEQFLSLPQFSALVLHALTFGLPLGWMFAEAERRHRLLQPRRAVE